MLSEETTTLNEPVISSQDRERENTLAIIKPDGMQGHKEAIIQKIKENHFDIVQEREIHLSKEQVSLFYREHEGKPFYNDLTNWMSSAPIYAMILQKENAIQEWRTLMGPTDSNKAREIAPNSIRALFGTDGSHNATHGSDGVTSAEREIDIIFGQAENKTGAKEHETSPTVIEHSNTEAAGLDLSHLNTADADSIPVDDNETPAEALVDATVPVDGHASAVNNPKEETADLLKENKQHDTTFDEEVKTEIAHTEPSSFEIDTQHISDTQSNMDATTTRNDTAEFDNSTKDEPVAVATKDDDNEKEEVVVVATLETVNADIKKDEPVEKENQAITNDQAVEETDIKEAAATKEEEKEEKHNEITSEPAAEVVEEKKEEEEQQEQEEEVKVVVEINAEATSDDAKEEEKETVPSQAVVVEDVKTDNNKEEEEKENEKQVAVEVEVAGPEVTVTIAEEKDSVEEIISEPVVEQKEESIDKEESKATDSKLVDEKQEAPAVDVSITTTVTNEPEVILQSNDVISEAKEEHDEDDVKDENTSETVTEERDLIDITVAKVSAVAEEDQKQQPEKEEKEAAPQEVTVQETVVQDDVTDAGKEVSVAEEKISQNDISTGEEICLPQEIEQKEEEAAVPPPQEEASREIATQETTESQESKPVEVIVDKEIVIAETTTDKNNEAVTEITITTAPETAIESHEIAEEALTEINLDDNKEAQIHVTETVVNEKEEEEKEEEEKDKEIIQSNEDQLAEPVSVSESNNSNVTEENVISGNSSVTDVSSSDKEDKAVKRIKPKSGLRAPTKTGTVRKSATNEKVPVKAKTGGLARPSGVVKAPNVENNEKKTTTTKPARVPRVALLTKKTADVKKPEEDTKSSEKPKTTKATSTRSLVSRLTAPTAASARKKLDSENTTSEPAKKAPIKRTVPRTTTATDGIKKTTTTTKTKASNDIKPVVKKSIAAASARVAAKPTPTDQDATKKRISRASPPTSTGTIKKSTPTTTTAANKRTTDSKIAIGSRVSGHAPKEATPKTTTKKVVTKKATKDVPATTLKKKKVASPSESAESKPKKSEKTTSAEEEEHKIETDASTSAEIESKTEENEEETKTEASVSEEIKSEEHEEEVHEEEETNEEETHEEEERHEEEEEKHEEEQIVVTEEVEHHEEKKTEEVHIEESDAEVASITKLEVKDNTVKDRPRTPEVASIRSRFESLQHSQQLQPTNSKELRSKSPNRIADMISRFQ